MPVEIKIDSLDAFTRSYIECALWSSTDTDKDDQGEEISIYIGDAYTIDDIALETLKTMIADCAKFQADNSAALKAAYTGKTGNAVCFDAQQAGHDFWLTRCGHGAGFWDRGLGEPGDILTDAAQAPHYNNIDLYIGNDGKVYA